MVDDGAMLWTVDDVHGNELGAEGHHIQLSSKGLILLKHLNRDTQSVSICTINCEYFIVEMFSDSLACAKIKCTKIHAQY